MEQEEIIDTRNEKKKQEDKLIEELKEKEKYRERQER